MPQLNRSLLSLLTALALVGVVATSSPAAPRTQADEAEEPASATAADDYPEAARTAPLDATMPVDPKITTGELDNGLRYWIRENGWPEQRAELRLLVRAGSLLETEEQRGVAHFVEHMAFNGTERFAKQELVKVLESFGMRFGPDINAWTGFDDTTYMLKIPTDDPEIVETAFTVLEQWAGALTFDPEEVEQERGVVIEEWRMGRGAGARLRDQQFPVLLQGSRYAERLPIGTRESLEGLEREDLVSFYEDWYRPDLMAVIAVGDFDRERVEERIREGFADLEGPAEPRPRPEYSVPDHEETLFATATDPEATGSSVGVFHLMDPRPDENTVGGYRRGIAEGLYLRMLNQRLAERSQQPDPPFLGAGASHDLFIPTKEMFLLQAGVREGEVERGLEALLREAERIEQYGFTKSEVERQKSQVLRAFERIYTQRETQDSHLFAEEFTRAFLEGESTPGIEYEWEMYQRFVPEITLSEVNRVGDHFIRDDNRVVTLTAPESQADDLPAEDRLLAVLERVEGSEVEPYTDTVTDAPLLASEPTPGEIVEERRIDEVGVTEWTLSNGVTVVLRPTDFREDEVLFRAFSPGGTSLAPDEDWVAASSAVQVVSASGFGRFSPRQLTNMLSDEVVEVDPTLSPLQEGFRGGASPRDLDTLFRLVHLKFTQPRADRGTFELMRSQMKARLSNRDVSPEVAFREELQRAMTQDHPRRRPVTAALLDEMDLKTSYDFYRDRFADASDFTFVFVGSFEVASMRPLVERYLASLPSIGREESWRDENVDPPAGVVERSVYHGIEPKSQTAIVFSGELEEPEEVAGEDADGKERSAGEDGAEEPEGSSGGPGGDADEGEEDRVDGSSALAMRAMTRVLQTRLRNVLREDLGGTYSVGVSPSRSRVPDPEYTVFIGFGAEPDRLEELTDVVFEEIRELQEGGPTDQQLANVVEALRRSREVQLKENEYWLSQLVSAYRFEEDPREILEFEESLAQLDPEDVQEAARRYIDFDRYVQVSLYPEDRKPAEAEETARGSGEARGRS